ncbi:DoxX-like protein [Catellatospora citrea]|nr:DoxX-like protein [Catellatospora citrea]
MVTILLTPMFRHQGATMELAYWIVAALLAVFYLYAGGKKVAQSQEQLQPMMGWVDRVPMPLVRTIGALEILGAVGLILPPLTGIASWLAVAAAIGLALIQVGGIALHLSRGEARLIGLNIALLVAAAATAWLGTSWL